MRSIVVCIILILIIFIIEALYCRIARKHQVVSREHEEKNHEIGKENKSIFGKAISFVYRLVGDFTFLSFKIIGYIPSHAIRNVLYKNIYCMKLGEKCVIHFGLEARSPWNISIGNGTIIGDHAIMDARYGIKIGANVNLSSGVWIWTLQHDMNANDFGVCGQGNSVIIDDRAWISSRTSILPGCRVLEGCVLACGAVLTKSTEERFGVYGGIPAKCISKRNSCIKYEFDGKHRLFL